MGEQVLIYADTIRSAEMRHEVPLSVPDPFFYAEVDGSRHAVAPSMEVARMADLGLELHPNEEIGVDEIQRSDRSRVEMIREMALRVCRLVGITDAIVPFWFPTDLVDHLRGNGIALRSDGDYFSDRRRVKNAHEIAGIRRAQRAAEAGIEAARELLGRAEPNGDGLVVDGEPLTVERVKTAMDDAFAAAGCASDEYVVAPGAQGAMGHEMGYGSIRPNEPVVIDVWPRDRASACFADMTRTFVAGEPTAEIADWHGLVREALDASIAAIRPGVTGRELNDLASDVFEEHGLPTVRRKEEGTVLLDGFYHGLGHGIGLEVHEDPRLGIVGRNPLVAGDVVTVEPGLYRRGFGGVRLEDLVLVTEDGAENLTRFPYDLAP